MSARTAAQHTPAELQYAGCDDTTAIVSFTAPSASIPNNGSLLTWVRARRRGRGRARAGDAQAGPAAPTAGAAATSCASSAGA